MNFLGCFAKFKRKAFHESRVYVKLFYGGPIYTFEKEGEQLEAVLVSNGHIVRTGTFEQLQPHAKSFQHLNGHTMIPGLVDSHIHLIGYGQQITTISLEEAKSSAEILKRLKEASVHLKNDEWLIAQGWNEFNLEDGMPTIQQLDEIAQPVLLHRVCRHVAMVNTKAIELVDFQSTKGGKVGTTSTGQRNGYFYDEAIVPFNEKVLVQGEALKVQLIKHVEAAIAQLQRYGLVGVHTEDCAYYGSYENVVHAFKQTVGQNAHFRLHLLRHHNVFNQMMHAEITPIEGFIEFGAMKIFVDGSFGGSTAALLADYTNEKGNTGLLVHSEQQFEKLVQQARHYNEAIAVHMIGDRAAELVLAMIEKYPTPVGKRDRLIHACLLNEKLMDRMNALPSIIVDIQPAFVPSDFPWVKNKLGVERLRYAYAWKALKNCHIALGTDAPIEDVRPLHTIYAAVMRNTYSEFPTDEALTLFEAFQAYTMGSAYAISKEYERGLIKEGYVADFTIFEKDPFHIDLEYLREIDVSETIVNGKTVYKK